MPYLQRKWPRLRDYDYSSEGWYFITICTLNRKCVLSCIQSRGEMSPALIQLTEIGGIVDGFIRNIPGIDKYVIMPNHIHLLLHKTNEKPIGADIRSLKTLTTKQIGSPIWQSGFYDHVIRDENDYLIKWRYIDENPAKWCSDEYYSGQACATP